MRKVFVEILIILVVLIFILSFNFRVYATSLNDLNTQKNQLNSQQNSISNQIDSEQSELTNIQTQKSQTLQDVESLVSEISSYQSQIDDLKSQVSDLQNQINETQKQIDDKQKEYDKQSDLLNQRLVAVYENGNTSYLDFILSSDSIVDFISNYYLASQVASADNDLINSISQTKQDIENKKQSLEDDKTEINNKLAQVQSTTTKLQADQVQKNAKAATLSDQEKQTQAQIEKLQNEQDAITKEIKAAEAKYQAALEAIKKQQQQSSSNNNKQNSSSTSGTYKDSASSGFLQKPVQTGTITATMYYPSGSYHGAIDYGVPVGTTVYAAADGVVLKIGWDPDGYGNYLVIQHLNSIQTWYGHGNGTFYVSEGQTVSRGQAIMQSGNTGNSTGAHLHFEVRVSPYDWHRDGNDSRRDPRNYM